MDGFLSKHYKCLIDGWHHHAKFVSHQIQQSAYYNLVLPDSNTLRAAPMVLNRSKHIKSSSNGAQ
jgi:hypothetical protein